MTPKYNVHVQVVLGQRQYNPGDVITDEDMASWEQDEVVNIGRLIRKGYLEPVIPDAGAPEPTEPYTEHPLPPPEEPVMPEDHPADVHE